MHCASEDYGRIALVPNGVLCGAGSWANADGDKCHVLVRRRAAGSGVATRRAVGWLTGMHTRCSTKCRRAGHDDAHRGEVLGTAILADTAIAYLTSDHQNETRGLGLHGAHGGLAGGEPERRPPL